MFFGRKKKPHDVSLAQALRARPRQAIEGKFVPREAGGGTLEIPLQQRRWAGFLFKLPAGTVKKFELDVIGKMVWDSCDGSTTAQQIIRKVARFCGISDAEAKASTLQFLNMLGKKGLIIFEVPKEKKQSK